MATEPTEKQLVEIVDRAIKEFRGDTTKLRLAIGYLFLTRQLGWKVTLLMHDKRTIKQYEEILQINSRDLFPEVGVWAHKSIAWRALGKMADFWKAVKGEIKGIKSTNFASEENP